MFCGECGAKIKKNAAFCGECGAKIPKENPEEEKEQVISEKPYKPMSKKKKIGLLALVIVIVLAVVGYNILKKNFGPEGVATTYFKALMSNDSDRIYDSLKLDGDTTFITKEVFKEVFDQDNNSLANITNYKLSEVDYSDDKLTATVKFTVMKEKESGERTVEINVVKQSTKKFLIFDEWELANDNISVLGIDLVEDYQIRVPKGAKVSIEGIELTNEYLSSEESTDELDVYVIPNLFATTIDIKTVLPSGIEINDEESVSRYNSRYTAELSLKALSDDMVTKIQEQIKNDLTTMYANIIAKKDWNAVKESYSYNNVNLSDLQDEYVELYEDIAEDDDKTLKSFEVTNVTLTNVKLSDDGELVVSAKFNYNYTIDYQTYKDETKTKEGKSSYNTTITYDYFENAYKIKDIYGTVTYFSIY